eukprot:TRINITY_DN5108_c0_g1_i1.p1 TRINITY_DN5108_c0_g1~~TRINITY_DN5108_c0_g1_i1.p1  ORF type:complete len:225 (+),score=70.34 TRINITY_DN5108_c0_g1_i1:98-772(+)
MGKKRCRPVMSAPDAVEELKVEKEPVPKKQKVTVGGPHFTMKNRPNTIKDDDGNLWTKVKNDDWSTCKESWADIAPYLRKFQNKCIWQPFYYDGECVKHLRELGFKNVIHEKFDFFLRCQDAEFLKNVDLIWDNPPYTGEGMKERVLTAAASTGKPFLLLLPSSILFSNTIRDVFSEEEQKHIQVISHRRVFVKKTGDNQNPVPFKYLVWVGYKVKLERDFILA